MSCFGICEIISRGLWKLLLVCLFGSCKQNISALITFTVVTYEMPQLCSGHMYLMKPFLPIRILPQCLDPQRVKIPCDTGVIYCEHTLPAQCAYVSVCTTKTCLLVFSLISNHNGAHFYYHFLSILVERFTTSVTKQPVQRAVHLSMCNLMIISLEITDAGLTAALLKRSAPSEPPVGCITWESCLHIFLKFQSNRC